MLNTIYAYSESDFPASVDFSTVDYSDYSAFRISSYLSYGGSVAAGNPVSAVRECHIECLSMVEPVSLDATTRTASLMQTINNYNIDNSYTYNSPTVNYYIRSLADDGSVSDIYAPNLFDEDTMIFTDPETGTKYQAAGWLYNYETRT